MMRLCIWNNELQIMHKITTPADAPKHPVIGQRFKAWDGYFYYCESHEEPYGYWMVREISDGIEPRRSNISENAVGRTYHLVR